VDSEDSVDSEDPQVDQHPQKSKSKVVQDSEDSNNIDQLSTEEITNSLIPMTDSSTQTETS